jgi:DNA-directed RNA polymerase I, II, and III subunit RPABC2
MSDDEKSVENDDAASSTSNSDNENSYILENSSTNDSEEEEEEEEEEMYSDDEKNANIQESSNSAAKNDNSISELYNGNNADSEGEEEDEDDDNDDVFQKFNNINKLNYVSQAHPECLPDNYEEIISLTKLTRDENNNIVDPLHKTLPILTKYERARVLGQRAKQIEHGGDIFVNTDALILEPHIIAEYELKFKKIPFIIKRPIPGGGGFEYWALSDLEDLNPL